MRCAWHVVHHARCEFYFLGISNVPSREKITQVTNNSRLHTLMLLLADREPVAMGFVVALARTPRNEIEITHIVSLCCTVRFNRMWLRSATSPLLLIDLKTRFFKAVPNWNSRRQQENNEKNYSRKKTEVNKWKLQHPYMIKLTLRMRMAADLIIITMYIRCSPSSHVSQF